MIKERPNTRESLACNLRILMQHSGMDQVALAKRSGVSQKTISNITNARTSATLDKIDAIASVFGLNSWHLIMPQLPEELVSGGTIEKLYTAFIKADPKGREYIQHVADREARYLENDTPTGN